MCGQKKNFSSVMYAVATLQIATILVAMAQITGNLNQHDKPE